MKILLPTIFPSWFPRLADIVSFGAALAIAVAAGNAGAQSVCETGNGSVCDDGDPCSFDDHCVDGECLGKPAVIPGACRWAMVTGGSEARAESRIRSSGSVVGSVCGRTTRVDDNAVIDGDVVAAATTGTGSYFGASASVSGCIVTGGASIASSPGHSRLPGLDTDLVPGGSCQAQSGDASRLLDATGPNPKSDDCRAAIDDVRAAGQRLNSPSFPASETNLRITIADDSDATITAKKTLNVVDFLELDAGTNSTLTFDGKSIPNVVFVLRINRRLYLRTRTRIVLTGGATADRVILYSRGTCRVGADVTGSGTLFCPNRGLKVDQNTVWSGAMISGSKRADLRHNTALTHVALAVVQPES